MRAPYLQSLSEQLDTLADTRSDRRNHRGRSPFLLREGGLIRDGYQEARRAARRPVRRQGHVAQIEAREKEKTGIRNLRVGYNSVFGYYIEVAEGAADLVPDNYIRKQTLSTGERYITEELKELESTILTARTGSWRWNTTVSASCGSTSPSRSARVQADRGGRRAAGRAVQLCRRRRA